MIVEGQKVIYAGDTDPFNEVGAPGKVIAMSGEAAHVQWLGGPKAGGLDLVALHELVADRQQASGLLASAQPYLDDAPATMGDASMQVRASYDAQGEDGAVTALDESGHLAMLAEYAEMAVLTLCGQIHADASMTQALASLETDERDVVVAKIATTLLTDRLREV